MSSQTVTGEKATMPSYGTSFQPTPLIPPPDRPSRLPTLLKLAIGLLVSLRICFIPAFYFIHRAHTSVPPLDPSFVAQCNSLLSAPSSTYPDRLARLVSGLEEAKDSSPAVWIAEPGPSSSYFLGAFSSSDWSLSERPFLVAITPASDGVSPNITLLTPEFERIRAQLKPIPSQVEQHVTWIAWQESESSFDVLARHLGDVGQVIMDPMSRNFIADGVRGTIQSKGVKISSEESGVTKSVALIRERKDGREGGLLRCANQMTLHAIRRLRSRMHLGITESKTRSIREEEMAKTGLIGGDGLVLFGSVSTSVVIGALMLKQVTENAALPHGSGTDRKLGREDFVLIDAGGKWGEYVADITRTFALPGSKIPKSHLELWETVRRAQYAPYHLLESSNTSGPPALGDFDIAARRVVTDFMPDFSLLGPEPDFSVFTHRLGHGIGMEGHEAPYLVQGLLGEKKVQAGHVFSLEPGIYLPADGPKRNGLRGVGVRLEDCFVVREDGQGGLDGEWLSGPVRKWGDI